MENAEINYRELGTPARLCRNAQTRKDVDIFRKQHLKAPLYISVYSFKKLEKGIPDYTSVIINEIFFEIESSGKKSVLTPEVHGEEKKLITKMGELKIPYPRITFSGRRGYHNECFFPATVFRNPNETIREGVRRLIEEEWGIKYLDKGSLKGITQMKRLVNSKHPQTNLYAIRVTPEEICSLSYIEILDLAKKPREVPDYEKILFQPLSSYLLNVDSAIEQEKMEEINKRRASQISFSHPLQFKQYGCEEKGAPFCIRKLMNKMEHGVNLTHFERFIFVSYMGSYLDGKNKEGTILKYFSKQPDFSKNKTEYQVHHILNKSYYPPGCKKIKKIGLCKYN